MSGGNLHFRKLKRLQESCTSILGTVKGHLTDIFKESEECVFLDTLIKHQLLYRENIKVNALDEH